MWCCGQKLVLPKSALGPWNCTSTRTPPLRSFPYTHTRPPQCRCCAIWLRGPMIARLSTRLGRLVRARRSAGASAAELRRGHGSVPRWPADPSFEGGVPGGARVVHLVRHAESQDGARNSGAAGTCKGAATLQAAAQGRRGDGWEAVDSRLSALGKQQALELRRRSLVPPPQLIISSPLSRALATAEALAWAATAPVIVADRDATEWCESLGDVGRPGLQLEREFGASVGGRDPAPPTPPARPPIPPRPLKTRAYLPTATRPLDTHVPLACRCFRLPGAGRCLVAALRGSHRCGRPRVRGKRGRPSDAAASGDS